MSTRRWRHLDFGACRVWLEARIARVACRRCRRIRTEVVPWARPGARHTQVFEDLVAWLAQRMDKSAVAALLRCAWRTVDHVVRRVVADHLADHRFDHLLRVGVDEISYRRGHKYLTLVVDHDTGEVVWAAKGRDRAALRGFYEQLGPGRRLRLEAVSMDMGSAYRSETEAQVPHAAIAFDPFHVIQLANRALDQVFTAARVQVSPSADSQGRPTRSTWRATRYALRASAERLDPAHHALLAALSHRHVDVYRAWQLKEQLRALYRDVPPARAGHYLDQWIDDASHSHLRPMANLARTVATHRDQILNAVVLDLSNSRVEGINGKVRLIQRRGYGHHDAAALIAMVYLCCSGIRIPLPTQT
ncbi:MAG: ISL3 family transposase [Candidatus Nanopelagicales bacterium]|jgi:transposase|nr:ISL3 family transposase [Candidatus Nanopelagicales bacterium]